MRRALLAVFAGSLLLPVAACDNDAKSTAEPTSTVTVPDDSLPPLPDYSVNTKKICAQLQTVYSGELRDFGTAMGQMVTFKEAKQTPDAAKAENQAAAKLKAAGAKIRQDTATAEDPDFQAAGKVSASKLESSATDRRYMDKVKSMADLNKTVQAQFTEWLTPVAGYCGTSS